ncbi:conjugal transfer protein TraG, partial [Salmonella enterica]|nr:conjugal transfer protein TraG [Salmonella enterica]
MYIAFPLGWFTLMGWTGVKIGNLVSNGIDKAGSMSEQAGAAGPKAAEGAAKAVVTKGKSLMKK